MNYKSYNDYNSKKYRRFESQRTFFITLAATSGIVLICIGLVYLIVWSPLFRVQSLTVDGANLATPPHVLRTVVTAELLRSAPWWRGILGPENTLFWSLDTTRKLTGTSYLKSITLQTSLLRRSVTVAVEERRALGVWCVGERACFVFDQNGIVFAKAPEVRGVLITKVNDESGRIIAPHGGVLPYNQWFANMLHTLEMLDEARMGATRVALHNIELREWEATTTAGLTFHFSLNFIPENLSKIMRDVQSRLAISELTYLDFRVPNRLYYR